MSMPIQTTVLPIPDELIIPNNLVDATINENFSECSDLESVGSHIVPLCGISPSQILVCENKEKSCNNLDNSKRVDDDSTFETNYTQRKERVSREILRGNCTTTSNSSDIRSASNTIGKTDQVLRNMTTGRKRSVNGQFIPIKNSVSNRIEKFNVLNIKNFDQLQNMSKCFKKANCTMTDSDDSL